VKTAIARRLDALEQRRSKAACKVVVLISNDRSDVDRQIAEMRLSGALAASDGLLIVTSGTVVPAMGTLQ
jgi:hypothetical protein